MLVVGVVYNSTGARGGGDFVFSTLGLHFVHFLNQIFGHTTLHHTVDVHQTESSVKYLHNMFNWLNTTTFVCCDVTKTTVNETKNGSKMADISLLQVKIFQELSKI